MRQTSYDAAGFVALPAITFRAIQTPDSRVFISESFQNIHDRTGYMSANAGMT